MNDLQMALKMARPFNTLDLSVTTYNAIARWGNGIKSIADLYVYHNEHKEGLKHIRGIGNKSMNEINALLVDRGLPTLEQLKEQTNEERWISDSW